MKFSERTGARPPPMPGLEEAPEGLRTALWNAFHSNLLTIDNDDYDVIYRQALEIWRVMNWRTDQIPASMSRARDILSNYWFSCSWLEFYDALEILVRLGVRLYSRWLPNWIEQANHAMEQEGCAYRFIGEQLAPVTNAAEMQEVATAADSPIPAVGLHIRESLGLLPPNKNSSPRNSVKEAILAVEAALKHLVGAPGATLSAALPVFEGRYGAFHPAFRLGLEKLYAYTNDEGGIRHALTEESAHVTVSDARFMLIACSAFANYLVSLSSRSRPQ